MSKRFTATELWEEDWFLDMPNEYKLFWGYMLSTCDHAGVFKVNLRSFCNLLSVSVSGNKALEYFNSGKNRIRVVSSSIWFIEDFFVFQYGTIFNPNNKLHESIDKIYKRYNINTLELRGLLEVKEKSFRGQKEDFDTLKDKDKDKDKDKEINTVDVSEKTKVYQNGNGAFKMSGQDFIDFKAQLKADRVFIEPLLMNKIKEKDLDNWINVYHIHIAGEDKLDKDYKEYKKHFKNWLNLQDTTKPPSFYSTRTNVYEEERAQKLKEFKPIIE